MIVRRWLLFSVLILSLALPAGAAAQGSIRVSNPKVDAVFRDHITFTISVDGDNKITAARLFYNVAGQTATFLFILTPNAKEKIYVRSL